MSDHELGAYTPPTTDAPLSFDARQPVPGSRPIPFTLIISALVLIALTAAIVVFYRSGVRQAGQPPQTVGAPVGDLKAPPPAGAQPQDPAAGLQIYKSEAAKDAAAAPKFTAPPEQPQARTAPIPVVITPPPAAAVKAPPAAALRPALPAAPVAKVAPTPPVAQAAPTPPKAQAAPVAPKAPVAAQPAPKAPATAAAASGAAGTMVQIGAFSSQAIADKGWNDAAAVAPGLAAGKGKAVEKVEKDGHTLFRTTVTGFADRAAANAFCGKLKAAGKACFVK